MKNRKLFADSVTTLPSQEGIAPHGLMVRASSPQHGKDRMTLLFSLAMPASAQEDLEERVSKGEVIPIGQLNDSYSPKAADVTSLKSWLEGQGFEIVRVNPDNTGVYARADLDQIQKSLDVNMVRVTRDGLTYNAACNAPSLPADVAGSVHAIIGLQPFRRAHKHFRFRLPSAGISMSRSAAGSTLTRNTANTPPYLVKEILGAYSADRLSVTGKGQTIAILIDTFPSDQDLQAFWTFNDLNIPLAQIEKVPTGTSSVLPVPEGEETLDAEWASAIAPGAKVRIYASGSLSFVDLDMALDRILADLPEQPGMRQLSISLGLGETFLGGPQGEVATQHQKFLRLAATGVNVFVSSGDAGSNPDVSGHNSSGATQAEYEASDPFVIGVGGTSLSLNANGQVANETAWPGSGGGESIFFARPVWQTGQGVPAGRMRLVPDVSLAADPERGALIVFQGQQTQIGGTSWSAPVWAAFCALMNEARIGAGKNPLPFLNPLIYPLMNTCFRDISNGTNGAFRAGPGYDMVTGIGVPKVKDLISSLCR